MKPVFKRITEEAQPEDTESEELLVEYKGAKPSISDFVTTILSQEELGEVLGDMLPDWNKHKRGQALAQGKTMVVDTPNGYVRYEEKFPDNESLYIEFCYWNCADGKHKLIAENVVNLINGKPFEGQYTGLSFYMYDNDRRKMQVAYASDLGINYDPPAGFSASLRKLPRTGKTIVYEYFLPAGKITKRFTWNGKKFVAE